ncbi:hypothetical protein RIF29_17778 [Crotalaria pallida]|uniref:Uncharacterized protein n=1 Tax=Crotalaria pallida TaxID=3830 RepID=A0AAN9FIQ4_CROPI
MDTKIIHRGNKVAAVTLFTPNASDEQEHVLELRKKYRKIIAHIRREHAKVKKQIHTCFPHFSESTLLKPIPAPFFPDFRESNPCCRKLPLA